MVFRAIHQGMELGGFSKYTTYREMFMEAIDYFAKNYDSYKERTADEDISSCLNALNTYYAERTYSEEAQPSLAIEIFINIVSDMVGLDINVYALHGSTLGITKISPTTEVVGSVDLIYCGINKHYDVVLERRVKEEDTSVIISSGMFSILKLN